MLKRVEVPLFLLGGGHMGALIRAHDWRSTPLGDPHEWPTQLTTLISLLLVSPQPMFLAWGEQRTWLYNDGFTPILGDKHPRALGRPAMEVWAEAKDVLEPMFDRVFAGEPFYMDDFSLELERNGLLSEAHFSFSYTPVREESGPVVCLFGTCIETTSAVVNARLLAESQERLQMALSAANSIGTWDWDIAANRVVADARFAALYGVEPERAKLGAPVAEFFGRIHHDDIERVQAELTSALQTGEVFASEYRLTQPDGGERWVVAQGRCSLSADGEPLRFPGTSFDITERKRAEEQLRNLNANLERKVIERAQARGRTWQVSPDLLGALNSRGYFETSNPAWKTVLGWSEEEVASMSIFELLHPDDVERTRDGFNLTQQGQPAIEFPNRYRCKDGSYRWISWVGVPEDGMVYCTGRDITRQTEQAEALKRTEETLRQSQKMEAVGQLTGGLAHDFNNLLTGISGSLQMIQTRTAQGRMDVVDRYIAAAQGAVKRAAALTHRLLAFSRRQTLEPSRPTSTGSLPG